MQEELIVSLSGATLPEAIHQLHKPPLLLTGKGDTSLLETGRPRVAIVGARKYSPYGQTVTTKLASELARAGVIIVSGLALGIDSLAHRACLDAGGQTIAVLPSGINHIYPRSHLGLASRIIENGGLLISEHRPDDATILKYRFLERNRLIAACADAILITEAATASGSLNTAHYALDLGIPVLAVPGNITSATSSGTNRLIKQGATPVLETADILEILNIKDQSHAVAYMPENEIEKYILDIVTKKPSTIDELLVAGVHEPQIIQTHLTMLEIKGVASVNFGKWSAK